MTQGVASRLRRSALPWARMWLPLRGEVGCRTGPALAVGQAHRSLWQRHRYVVHQHILVWLKAKFTAAASLCPGQACGCPCGQRRGPFSAAFRPPGERGRPPYAWGHRRRNAGHQLIPAWLKAKFPAASGPGMAINRDIQIRWEGTPTLHQPNQGVWFRRFRLVLGTWDSTAQPDLGGFFEVSPVGLRPCRALTPVV